MPQNGTELPENLTANRKKSTNRHATSRIRQKIPRSQILMIRKCAKKSTFFMFLRGFSDFFDVFMAIFRIFYGNGISSIYTIKG